MKHVQHLISEYLDEELLEKDRFTVEVHLKTCETCQQVRDELLNVKQQVSNAFQSTSVSSQIEKNVISFLEQRRSRKLRRSIQMIWYGIPAIFTLLLFIALAFPVGNLSISLFHAVLKVGVRMLHIVPVLLQAFPSLLFGILLFTAILIFISGWSLRRLLSLKVTG